MAARKKACKHSYTDDNGATVSTWKDMPGSDKMEVCQLCFDGRYKAGVEAPAKPKRTRKVKAPQAQLFTLPPPSRHTINLPDGIAVHHGKCGDVLKTLPDCSVDALVTDPPSGIAFMNKKWDKAHGGRDGWINDRREEFAEALRVLKPGAYALVWALPRTSHWTMTALEDAGFEIHDVCHHLFASGNPKGLDIYKSLAERPEICQCQTYDVQCSKEEENGFSGEDLHHVRRDVATTNEGTGDAQPDMLAQMRRGASDQQEDTQAKPTLSLLRQAVPSEESCFAEPCEILQREMCSDETSAITGTSEALEENSFIRTPGMDGSEQGIIQPQYDGIEQSGMARRRDSESDTSKLHNQTREMPAGISPDGKIGRLYIGTPARDGEEIRALPESRGSRASYRSQSVKQSPGQPSAIPEQRRTQTCGTCGKIKADAWHGYNTALKPAVEEWILCQKPREGTYAENVLAWNVGGLNIDASRVGTAKDVPASPRRAPQGAAYGDLSHDDGTGSGWNPNTGRWPAHLILSHTPECEEIGDAWECAPGCPVAELDRQSGTLKSGNITPYEYHGGTTPAGLFHSNRITSSFQGDEGGASRFFTQLPGDETIPFHYFAKPSRTEREKGLVDMTAKTGGEATGRKDGSAGLNSPQAGSGRTGGAKNFHPTVKSVPLMKWLITLVTPPTAPGEEPPIILDMYAGSGTTGVAAIELGLRCILIEMDAEDEGYIDLIYGRIEHARQRATRKIAA